MNIKKSSNVIDLMRDFLKLESASGMVLIGANDGTLYAFRAATE